VATCPSGHASTSDDFCDVCGVLIGAAPSLAPDTAQAGAARGTAGGTAGPGAAPGSAQPAPGDPCPRCGVTRAGQFCESCGYDFTLAGQDTFGPDAYQAPAPPPGPPAPPPGPPPFSAPPASVPPASVPPASVPAAQVPPGVPGGPGAADAEWTAVVTADRAYYESVSAVDERDNASISFPGEIPERRIALSGTEIRIGRRSVRLGIEPEIDLIGPPLDPGVSRLHAKLVPAPDGSWTVVDLGTENGIMVNGRDVPSGDSVHLRPGDRIHLGAWTKITITRG